MSQRRWSLASAAILVLACQPAPGGDQANTGTTSADDEQVITRVIEQEVAAAKANNADSFMQILAPDATIKPPNEPPRSGPAVRTWLENMFRDVSSNEMAYNAALAIEPDNNLAGRNLARIYLAIGQYDSAKFALHRAAELARYPYPQETDAFVDALRDGKTEDARRILKAWEQKVPFPDYILATLYARLRDRTGVLRMLRRSVARHEPEVHELRSDPDFAWLRSDPEFRGLLRRLKFPGE